MASAKGKQLHVVAMPLPGYGHTTPFMRFCGKLASQEGFIVTFVQIQPFVKGSELSKQEHERSAPDASTDELGEQKHENVHAVSNEQEHAHTDAASHEKLNIRRVCIPMEIPELGDGSGNFDRFFGALPGLAPHIEELLAKLIHEDGPITCLISDLYMTNPTQKIADKFNIPRVAFNTASQSVLLFTHYILEGTVSLEEVLKIVARKEGSKMDIFVDNLLGLPTLRNGDIMDYHDDNAFLHKFTLEQLKDTEERAHAFIVNSCKELEGHALEVNMGLPTYAIGPLSESLDDSINIGSWKEDKDCILWLDEQPPLSVLYVSFGSFASLSQAQFDEILSGLVSSQQRFLWVFRPNLIRDAHFSDFPAELLSNSDHKGHFVKWAPQLKVLSHRAVGGFLTHCGWNSTIEAISLGVPMLCFPYMSDQFMNAKFIIEEWKVGLGFKISKERGLLERDEVERVTQSLMVGEEGKTIKRNINYFKEKTYQNLQHEAALFKNIQALFDSLK